jgi:ribonuclease R
MTPFAIQLTRGFKPEELDSKDIPAYERLEKKGALEEVDGLKRLKSIYRAGEVYVNSEGKGFLSSLFKEQKDLLIEPKDLGEAKNGDFVVVKRVIARRGRPSAKVVDIIKHAVVTSIYILKKVDGKVIFEDIKTGLPSDIFSKDIDIKIYKEGTLFKVNALTNEVVEILGNINEPKVDEKISLALFNRFDEFPSEATKEALEVPSEVKEEELKERVDLRHLPFCTIDPVTAKDFDDAIYWDTKENTLYVAIADVSYYVPYFSAIDREAIKRGFTTYFPHKAFPMLPRELSENICSLKPHVDRLSFVAKMKLNDKLEVEKAEFFEAVIHSKRRFNYDEIDEFLAGEYEAKNESEKEIFKFLKPLYELTRKLKAKRLKKGFDFRSDEIRLELDSNHKLKDTTIETGTPSHSLIEECMLLANQSAAKKFTGEGDAIFRIHEEPKEQKLQTLIAELASIGVFVETKENEDVNTLIKTIQKEASKLGLESEVDELIIKSLKQASYSSFNVGHFGLGFDFYSHFTSPIRRYSDLILHRLIKAKQRGDKKEIEYLLRNIEPLSARVSELERESTKCEWDFRDRKFARWAKDNVGKTFKAKIVELDLDDPSKGATAKLLEGAKGATVHLKNQKSSLFDEVDVEISEANIENPTIMATEK